MLDVIWHSAPPDWTFTPVGRVGVKVWYDGPFCWQCRSGDHWYRCCLLDARDAAFLAGYSVALAPLLVAGGLERWTLGNKLLSKAKAAKAARTGKVAQVDKAWSKLWPVVMAFMTETVDSDDEPREPSKVTLFFDAGALRACLSDPTNEQSLYVTLDSPGAALDVLEKALGDDEPDWRPWGGKRKPRK